MGILKHIGTLIVCCAVVMATACGGSQLAEDSAVGDLLAADTGNSLSAIDLSTYEPDSDTTGLPVIPEEETGERSTSAWDISLTEVLGSEYILQEGSLVDGTDLLVGAGEGSVQSDQGNYAYGMYQLSCEPGTRPLSLNIECTPSALNEPYFVAVANYTDLRWQWFGPVNMPEFQLDLAGPNKQFSTRLGNLYFLILAPEGSIADHAKTTMICGAPEGDEQPGCPNHLVASDGQVPDAVKLDWLAGNDNAGFQVFRRDTNPEAEWKLIGETQQTHFLDTHAPDFKLFFYRVRSVNPNGESCFSNVDSGFAGGGAEPGIITGQITGINGEPIPGIAVGLLGFGEQMIRPTNQEGKFLYRDLPPGKYLVVPLNEELKFFPPARLADLTEQVHVDMHFNAAPEAIFHRVHGFAVALNPPESELPPVIPLEGVTIRVNPLGDPDNAITTTTDALGHYNFEDLPEGTYMLRAFLQGMEFVPDVHEVVINGFNPPDRRDFFGHPADGNAGGGA
ncbi:MAG: carboxypeptidase regulatory-like domain-containing protein [Planctomycetales bacterium]|nr:carboxypeptidase regulatory-like domain-containing protein [bacterium]UNM07255.1 MAG: carboxypeptidase regulatory-like domain-containing protein [Planctomycetales bacterium]